MRRIALGIISTLVLTSCSSNKSEEKADFSSLANEFVYTSLSFSPAGATQTGYHVHNGAKLDEQLDDFSPTNIRNQRDWYESFRGRLKSVKADALSPEDRADFDTMQDQISAALLEFDNIQNYRHNPTMYVELIGNALNGPYLLEYTDKKTRFQQIIARLQKVPTLLKQARENLQNAPEIWNKVAQQENDGTIDFIDKELRNACPPELKDQYKQAADGAVLALRDFGKWLETDLSKRTSDWRLGADKYNPKFRYVLQTDETPDKVLNAAQQEMKRTRDEMYKIALPMYQKLKPGANTADQNAVIKAVLDQIAKKHSTPDTYIPDAEKDLTEATAFVKQKDLLTLPPRSNLKVIPTPEFMRGIYSVGGFQQAPALEPQLGAFYWITPIPKDWPADRIESKLREYNTYGVQLLTLHEAMPGHYVQLEYANDIEPKLRRIFRSVFGNGAYVEGWAVYATEMMLDNGYLDNNPELRLTFLKQQLRVTANAILDIKLQTLGMTDDEAMDLMMNQAFQEKEEARGKLQRAKLSSTQLPTYFVGWRDWHRVRDRYKEVKGSGYTLKAFNESALKEGAVPLPTLAKLLTGKGL